MRAAQANMRGQGPRAARASQAENERSEFSACCIKMAKLRITQSHAIANRL